MSNKSNVAREFGRWWPYPIQWVQQATATLNATEELIFRRIIDLCAMHGGQVDISAAGFSKQALADYCKVDRRTLDRYFGSLQARGLIDLGENLLLTKLSASMYEDCASMARRQSNAAKSRHHGNQGVARATAPNRHGKNVVPQHNNKSNNSYRGVDAASGDALDALKSALDPIDPEFRGLVRIWIFGTPDFPPGNWPPSLGDPPGKPGCILRPDHQQLALTVKAQAAAQSPG